MEKQTSNIALNFILCFSLYKLSVWEKLVHKAGLQNVLLFIASTDKESLTVLKFNPFTTNGKMSAE